MWLNHQKLWRSMEPLQRTRHFTSKPLFYPQGKIFSGQSLCCQSLCLRCLSGLLGCPRLGDGTPPGQASSSILCFPHSANGFLSTSQALFLSLNRFSTNICSCIHLILTINWCSEFCESSTLNNLFTAYNHTQVHTPCHLNSYSEGYGNIFLF